MSGVVRLPETVGHLCRLFPRVKAVSWSVPSFQWRGTGRKIADSWNYLEKGKLEPQSSDRKRSVGMKGFARLVLEGRMINDWQASTSDAAGVLAAGKACNAERATDKSVKQAWKQLNLELKRGKGWKKQQQ